MAIQTDAEKLLALKGKIERIKTQRAQAEGRLEELMGQLKRDHSCGSLEEAREKLEGMEGQAEKLAEEIRRGVEELEGML
jgi:phage shock protein A